MSDHAPFFDDPMFDPIPPGHGEHDPPPPNEPYCPCGRPLAHAYGFTHCACGRPTKEES